ncbi:hypothetical protein CCAX7_002090 [Capsulimonas corticalis]|uniref:Uncharacterized protein n=1 Tax=Capsulimonas corticalis TaxID=2219043 RepID=A0A402CRY7_9BACT|nr:hypothetical protein [Capsulimonas corticalis]BDI28158.1 hypothetical protein CCAX7_002090 [Capsulimonas corticalis]
MRKSSIFVLAAAALAAGALSARPASAQVFEPPAASVEHNQPISLRVGAYFPTNRKIRKDVGQTFPSVGVDYHLHQDSATSDTFVSLDYIDRGASNFHMRVVPLTYGIRYVQDLSAKNSVYYGFGAGAYYTNIDVSNDTGGHETNNDLLVGGFLNLGVNINQASFLDLRYHFTSSSGSVNPGGPQVSVGFRF